MSYILHQVFSFPIGRVNMINLTEEEKKAFVEVFNKYTHETLPHEQKVISRILDVSTGKDDWRFIKGQHCKSCGKETRNLDFFLSAVVEHGLEFIKNEASKYAESDPSEINISVAKHDISVTCTACGEVSVILACTRPSCGYYSYRYPGNGVQIRLSQEWYDRIVSEIHNGN